jgi:hypothetical protein
MRSRWPLREADAGASSWCSRRSHRERSSGSAARACAAGVGLPRPGAHPARRRVRIPPPSRIFVWEAVPTQEAREHGRSSHNSMFLQQPCGQFGHNKGGTRLNRLGQECLIGHQLAAAWRSGAGEPVSRVPRTSFMAKLSLTSKCWAAALQEWPASTKAATRTRRSRE